MTTLERAELAEVVSSAVIWPLFMGQLILFLAILAKALMVAHLMNRANRRLWAEVRSTQAAQAVQEIRQQRAEDAAHPPNP